MFFDFIKKPKIHLYTICWNEEYMLPYFFRHYDEFVEQYIFLDDGSTDYTLEILHKHPKVEIRNLPAHDKNSYILAAQNVHENCWKESRGLADWVIITAVDELLYTPDLRSYLKSCKRQGVTVIPALGYQMISPTLPTENKKITELVKRGCPYANMNKLSIFNPNKITETKQAVGRHAAAPSGEVIYPNKDELLNLHYKYLSFEYTFKRHNELNEKLRQYDKDQAWGIQYKWSREEFQKDWDTFEQNAVEDIFSPNYDSNLMHSSLNGRWWRKKQIEETPHE